MFNWLRELLELRMEMRERNKEIKICESCEILKHQLSLVNDEKKDLLNRLIHPIVEQPTVESSEFKPVLQSHNMSWRVRQQMLEREDRERAKLLNQNREAISVSDLEKEMDIVSSEREGKADAI